MKYVIVTGNPVEGIDLIGPFANAGQAVEWAERECNDEWWLGEVTTPEDVL